MTATALVARGPINNRGWKLETVTLRRIRDDELLVRVVASGICLADVHFGDVEKTQAAENPAIYYPRVLGHEGSGYVSQVGSAVTVAKPGDPVLLSYASCGACYTCLDNHPAYCIKSFELNFLAESNVYKAAEWEEGSGHFDVGGAFFGQSSFASLAVVKERSVVNLRGIVEDERELQILAPLGCGVQTGSGALIRVAQIKAGQDVVVIGAGSVGLSAIMAAKMSQCREIIAIDRVQSRLDTARSLGATNMINTSDEATDLKALVLQITDGAGVHVSLDTTGIHGLVRESYDYTRQFGKVIEVGLAKPGDTWDIPMIDLMNSGKQILGCVQGDAVAQESVPEMIKWYREGVFPIQKIVTLYEVADFEKALDDMRRGTTIKPILVWPCAFEWDFPAPHI